MRVGDKFVTEGVSRVITRKIRDSETHSERLERLAKECETPDTLGPHVHVKLNLTLGKFRDRFCWPPGELTDEQLRWMAEEATRQRDALFPKAAIAFLKLEFKLITDAEFTQELLTIFEDIPDDLKDVKDSTAFLNVLKLRLPDEKGGLVRGGAETADR